MKRHQNRLIPLFLALAMVVAAGAAPARAGSVLFTFGEMLQLQGLPLASAKRTLSEEEVLLYQNFEFYAYSVFEALQVANNASILINHAPLFCAPEATFKFREEGDIARLADYVTNELMALTEEIGGPLDKYDDKPASMVLLLGLRAAFPCDDKKPVLAQR